MPCPGPFHFSYSVDYIYDPDPYVGLSIFVCDVEHTSFILVCAVASLFCACLVSVQVSAPCHSWQHTGVVHLSLQADGKVAFEDVTYFKKDLDDHMLSSNTNWAI